MIIGENFTTRFQLESDPSLSYKMSNEGPYDRYRDEDGYDEDLGAREREHDQQVMEDKCGIPRSNKEFWSVMDLQSSSAGNVLMFFKPPGFSEGNVRVLRCLGDKHFVSEVGIFQVVATNLLMGQLERHPNETAHIDGRPQLTLIGEEKKKKKKKKKEERRKEQEQEKEEEQKKKKKEKEDDEEENEEEEGDGTFGLYIATQGRFVRMDGVEGGVKRIDDPLDESERFYIVDASVGDRDGSVIFYSVSAKRFVDSNDAINHSPESYWTTSARSTGLF